MIPEIMKIQVPFFCQVKIIEMTSFPIGILTTASRDKWAASHQELRTYDSINAESLDNIINSLFVVCLDESTPAGMAETSQVILHSNGRNR